MATKIEFFSGVLDQISGEGGNIVVEVGLDQNDATKGTPLGSLFYRTHSGCKLLISEPGAAEIVCILAGGSEIQVKPDEQSLTNTHVDLRFGQLGYASILDMRMRSNRGNQLLNIDNEIFVGGRRRVRVRNRQLGAVGTMLWVRTFGVEDEFTEVVEVACIDGSVWVPYGKSSAELQISQNSYIVNNLKANGPGSVKEIVPPH